MEGVVELAEEIFHMPVRLGMPQTVNGLHDIVRNPIHSTGVGLLLYGRKQQEDSQDFPGKGKTPWSILSRTRNWLQLNF